MKAKENENRNRPVHLTEGGPAEAADTSGGQPQNTMQRLKKPLIFGLMGIVFFGCMYLIFAPSGHKEKVGLRLNDSVPQATGGRLQSDKQKAYEMELLESKEMEKRSALQSLADYWHEDTSAKPAAVLPVEDPAATAQKGPAGKSDHALNSYRNAQTALSSFYRDDNSEKQALQKELDRLKDELAQKGSGPANTLDNQVALMEKSYQMAAKYLPGGPHSEGTATGSGASGSPGQKEYFVAVSERRKSAVSTLRRTPSDSGDPAKRGFYTAGVTEQTTAPKNSIRACVDKTQTIEEEGDIHIRLLEPAQTSGRTIPQGTVLTANAKFQAGRLQLKVTSFESAGNILPVDITIYDVDGQQGLYVPYSAEMEAVKEMAASMSRTSGTSVMMSRSAGQQVAGELSKGVIQGLSGYLSKKVSTKKVTLKAGHQLFLVSKK